MNEKHPQAEKRCIITAKRNRPHRVTTGILMIMARLLSGNFCGLYTAYCCVYCHRCTTTMTDKVYRTRPTRRALQCLYLYRKNFCLSRALHCLYLSLKRFYSYIRCLIYTSSDFVSVGDCRFE